MPKLVLKTVVDDYGFNFVFKTVITNYDFDDDTLVQTFFFSKIYKIDIYF